MNTERLKKTIQSKLGNVITDAKAQSVIDKIHLHEQGDTEKVILSWANAIDIPEWVKSEITINETFFFRHPEQFQGVMSFLKGRSDVRVLSVGTSSGEEAYSLAMLCEELKINNYKIDAMDLDPRMINKAKIGKYPPHQIERTPSAFRPLLSKYGEVKNQIDGTSYFVNANISEHVNFFQENILNFKPGKYDLIFIRNILIYFSEDDQRKILSRLEEGLKVGGRIEVGPAEVYSFSSQEVA